MKHFLKVLVSFLLACSTMFSVNLVLAAEDEAIYEIVYEDEEQQTFYDWGVHFTQSADPRKLKFPEARQAMFAQFIRDYNVKIHRFDFNQNLVYDEDGTFHAEVIDACANNFLIPLAQNGCDKYLYTSWHPHSSKSYVDENNYTRIYEEMEDEYVQQVVQILKYMKEKGYPLPYAFSPQNEPAAHTVPLEQLMRLTIKFDDAFEKAGFGDILIAGPDVSNITNGHTTYWGENFSLFDRYPEYANATDILIYHAYGNIKADSESIAKSFRKGLEKYDFRVWQTEVSTIASVAASVKEKGGGNFLVGHAIRMFEALCGDIAWLKNDTWFYFIGPDNSNGHLFTDNNSIRFSGGEQLQVLLTAGWGADGVNSFQRTATANMLQILFTNVESGSKVHRLNSNDPDLKWQIGTYAQVVGFTNNYKTTLVVINTTDKTKKYDFKNLPGTTATVHSMDSQNWQTVQSKSYNIVDKTIKKAEIAPYSCNVIVIENEDTAAPRIDIAMGNEAFKELDGAYYVSEDMVDITGYTDEKALVNVNGSDVFYTDESNKFTIRKSVKKDTTFNVVATDKYGNKSEVTKVPVKYDPNYVAISFDEYEAKCSKDTYTLKGRTNKEGRLVIGDKTAEVGSDYTFSIDLLLNQGENLFEGVIYDNEGNASNKLNLKVMCDSIAPEITLSEEEIETNQRRYVVSGSMSEKVESLTVNGKNVVVDDNLNFTTNLELKDGENTVKFKATDLYGLETEKIIKATCSFDEDTYHKVDGIAYVRKASAPVKLDGVLDEKDWIIDIAADKEASGNPSLVSGFGTLWDNDYLYIAAVVKDNKVVYDHEQYAFYNDCVELMFNPSNEKAGPWVKGDLQLFSARMGGTKDLYVNSKTIHSAWNIIDGGYIVEIAVPWKTIGLTPKNGLKIGFDINVNDSDVSKVRGGIITWSGTANNYQTTADFGTLVLAGAGETITYAEISDDIGEVDNTVVVERDTVKIMVNGKETKTKNMPVLENGELRISIDTMIEISGFTYKWLNNDTVKIVLSVDSMTVQADNPVVQIGIHPDFVDVTPYRIDDGIYVGEDFAKKYSFPYFKMEYSYDEQTKTINFTK